MNTHAKLGIGLFLNFALIANQLLADLPPIRFESPEFVPWEPVTNHSADGWNLVSGSAGITPPGEGFGGSQALKLPKAGDEAWLRKEIAWDSAERTAFIDFQIKPTMEPEGSLASFVANGSQIAFQSAAGSATGRLWAFHGGDGTNGVSQWYATPGVFQPAPGDAVSSTWTRVTLRHDYDRNVWDLFIDGKLAAVNLAFEGRGENLTALDFFGSRHGDTLIDDLSARPANMLFPDADKDGLPDSWEIANGSNPNAYDRDAIHPATGKSFLDGYLASLWPAGSSAANGLTGVGNIGTIPPLTIMGSHQPVGALKGSFSVGGDGSAAYSIPIDLPKGTGGMEPKISLGYSSGAGNGLAGVGWGISGFQKITRGPKSAVKEGNYDPVDFDGDDRFFLDGERLICVKGTYGADQSEYRTEIDSFARITAIGNGPVSWKVETKAGLIVHLGGTADSRQQVSNGILAWGVNRVEDTVGNYYSVDYTRDSAAGKPYDFINDRIAAVHYTGNTAKGLAPYCHVLFDYEDRPDNSRAYTTHAGFQVTKRLSKIRGTTDGYTNHSYKFGYAKSWQTGRSLLVSATKLAEDNPAKAIPATTFQYDGLKEGEEIWAEPTSTRLQLYGNNLDASGDLGSMVTTEDDGTTIRLTGDVARAYAIPGGAMVESDTVLEFDFKSDRQSLGALIGLDTNTELSVKFSSLSDAQKGGPATKLFRIGGTGSIEIGPIQRFTGRGVYEIAPCFKGPTQPYSQGQGWKTFRLNLAPFGTGLHSQLVLMCADNSMSNGADEAIFRNIRIYRSGSQNPADVAPLEFDIGAVVPRLRTSEGEDVGIALADLNGDALPDLVNWNVTKYDTVSGLVTPTIEGEAFAGTGEGFRFDPSLLPPSTIPLGVRADASAAAWNRKHNLLAQPMDVDGDGNPDLCASVFVNPPGLTSVKLRSEFAFYKRTGDAWVEMPEWKLPFRFENVSTKGADGGDRRAFHVQWTDLNADGWPDLSIFTTPEGRLWDRHTNQLILGENDSIVYLNKGKDGPGWVRDDSHALPEALSGIKDGGPKEIGRRLMDLNGDGLPEIAEAWQIGSGGPGKETKRTYFLSGSGASRWNSTRGLANPVASPYDLPVTLIDSTAIDRTGVLILDCNGDGLPDLLQHIKGAGYGGPVINSWINHGMRASNPWVREGTAGAASYELPMAMHHSFKWDDPSQPRIPMGFEIADINGDGLVDVFYSNEDNFAVPGSGNFVLTNTGDGWNKRLEWGAPDGMRITYSSSQREAGKRYMAMMDMNGDGFPDLISHIIESQPRIWFNRCRPEVLVSIRDGFDSEIQAEYRRLNDPAPTVGFGTRVYEKGTGPLPRGQSAVIDARLVVSRYSEPDGMGGRRCKSQRYGDLRQDRFNETSLGFGWVEVLDELNGQRNRTETMREYPYAGSPVLSETYVLVSPSDVGAGSIYPGVTPGLKLVTQEVSEYAELPSQAGVGGTIRRPVQTRATKHTFDLDGTLKIGTVTTQGVADFDAFGFVKKSTVRSLDDSTVVTESVYQHVTDASRWHLGRLSQSTVTKNMAGEVVSKTAGFTYSPSNGLLTGETVEPGHPLSVTKSYEHDAFGNVTRTSVTASGEVRRTTAHFDARGRFATGGTNDLGHGTSSQYDQAKALLLSSTDIGGRTVRFHYDAFGTLIRTDNPGGTQSGEITGFASNASLPPSVAALVSGTIKYFRAKETSGAPPAFAYLDAMGRELAAVTTILRDANATGASRYSKIYAVTQYDWRGRKIGVSNPFAEGETPAFTFTTYDLLDRSLVTVYPDNGIERVQTYGIDVLDGQPVTYSKVVNRNGKTLERWEDQHGRFVRSRDPSGQLTRFAYDTESRMTSVSVGGETLLTNTFDAFGNKTAVWEANSGASSSVYNGFGEVVSTRNARGDVTTFAYDILGRKTTVAKPEGTYHTQYDHARGNGIGQPWKTTGPSGYVEEISYDSLGRPSATRKTQFGETFTTATTYDALGRTLTTTDAGGLVVAHGYDSLSFPVSLTLAGGVPGATVYGAGTVLWKAGRFDSAGRAIDQTLAQGVTTTAAYNPANGNTVALTASQGGQVIQSKGYQWDTLGNLTSRTDALAHRVETFGYDHLNRLVNSAVSATPGSATTSLPPPESYHYDIKGNLLAKGTASLFYDGPSPHAVTRATVKGFTRAYTYDAAGYVLNDSKRIYTWTSFGQLATLHQASAPSLGGLNGQTLRPAGNVFTAFDFDSGGNRARQTKERSGVDGSFSRETTLYLGSYEREVHENAGSVTRTVHRHSFGAVIYTRTDSPEGTRAKLTTVLKDHLGSTDLLLVGEWTGSAFTNPVIERQAFDPWGERRNAADFTRARVNDTDPFLTSVQDHDRGYTGHEQLDDSGLIHMNGRIYDPELGRFLAPDPYVQVPEYSQNFNRYSYVLNNPLNATDPSGFFLLALHTHKKLQWAKRHWAQIGPYVGIVVGIVLCWTGVGAMAGAAITGAAVGSTAATVASAALIGGVMGGVNAAMTGGNLGDILRGMAVGAIQGALSSGLHVLGETASSLLEKAVYVAGHGVVGGLANVAMGGKFSDGFLSAAASACASQMGISEKLGLGKEGDWSNVGLVAGRTAVAGIIGGTASALGGGKFANGAYTAAFQHLLNAEAESRIKNGVKFEIISEKIDEKRQRIYGFKLTKGDEVRYAYFNREHGIVAPADIDLAANYKLSEEHAHNLSWFKNQVKNKGPWDYKQFDRSFQDFGNFHYGFVGFANGLDEWALLKQAGRAQVAAGTSKASWGKPGLFGVIGGSGTYGDDPVDQYYIRNGRNAGLIFRNPTLGWN